MAECWRQRLGFSDRFIFDSDAIDINYDLNINERQRLGLNTERDLYSIVYRIANNNSTEPSLRHDVRRRGLIIYN